MPPAAMDAFVADLHIHSKYSRACSRDLSLRTSTWWARRKGITLLGTGDFTHPAWFDHLRDALGRAGLYRLTGRGRATAASTAAADGSRQDVRFML